MWLNFIVGMTGALAWPFVVLIILFAYRRTFPGLLDRLRSLRYGGLEAAFDQESARVAESISAEPQQPLAAISERRDERLLALANISPRAAVIEAWARIEARLHELTPATDKDTPPRRAAESIRLLREAGKINGVTEDALRGLMQLRNLAAHASERELSTQKAVDFITMTDAILWVLSSLR